MAELMNNNALIELEKEASHEGLLLRLQVRRPLNLWVLRLVVGEYLNNEKIQIIGEMKAWAYHALHGLQLDTMQVRNNAPREVGHLVWAATTAWALEETICRRARLLAINDESNQHRKLRSYFQKRGFETVRDVGSAPVDLPLRVIWGGAGTLMTADCFKVHNLSARLWEIACER